MLCRHGSSIGNLHFSLAKLIQCGYDSALIAQKNGSSHTGSVCFFKSKTRYVLDKVKIMFMFTDSLTPAYKECFSLDKKTKNIKKSQK